MSKFDPNATIKILAEKKLANKPSKGRNQWELLKQFHGKSVESFIEAAKAKTKQVSDEIYQSGKWWKRELRYNLDKGNIVLKRKQDIQSKGMSKKRVKRTNIKGNDCVSGLYVVTLNNEHLISSRADDKRHADKAVKVNKDHCKFGKAKNLAARRNNYYKTFGQDNVNFYPLAALENISRAEKAILKKLTDHKIKGPAGVKTEWLKGIDKDEIINIAFDTLSQLKVVYTRL